MDFGGVGFIYFFLWYFLMRFELKLFENLEDRVAYLCLCWDKKWVSHISGCVKGCCILVNQVLDTTFILPLKSICDDYINTIFWKYYNFGNFTDIKRISQHFSDCRLHNDKYTKFSPQKNCIFRALIGNTFEVYIWSVNQYQIFIRSNIPAIANPFRYR